MRFIAVFVVCVCLSGCGGGSPSSPGAASGGSGLTGDWTGQIVSRDWGTYSVDLSLAQSGSTLTGSWTAPADKDLRGSVTGTVTGNTIAGNMTITGCSGGASFSGTRSGNNLTLTSGQGFLIGSNCGSDTAGFTVTVSRR